MICLYFIAVDRYVKSQLFFKSEHRIHRPSPYLFVSPVLSQKVISGTYKVCCFLQSEAGLVIREGHFEAARPGRQRSSFFLGVLLQLLQDLLLVETEFRLLKFELIMPLVTLLCLRVFYTGKGKLYAYEAEGCKSGQFMNHG